MDEVEDGGGGASVFRPSSLDGLKTDEEEMSQHALNPMICIFQCYLQSLAGTSAFTVHCGSADVGSNSLLMPFQ